MISHQTVLCIFQNAIDRENLQVYYSRLLFKFFFYQKSKYFKNSLNANTFINEQYNPALY